MKSKEAMRKLTSELLPIEVEGAYEKASATQVFQINRDNAIFVRKYIRMALKAFGSHV